MRLICPQRIVARPHSTASIGPGLIRKLSLTAQTSRLMTNALYSRRTKSRRTRTIIVARRKMCASTTILLGKCVLSAVLFSAS